MRTPVLVVCLLLASCGDFTPHDHKKQKEEDKKEEWIPIGPSPHKLGFVSIEFGEIAVRRVGIRRVGGGKSASKEPMLAIEITVRNLSENKKIEWYTWGHTSLGSRGSDLRASLTDNFGNEYGIASFGTMTHIVGHELSESLYPGKHVADLLVFERPVETFKYLNLRLPGATVSQPGEQARLRIYKERVTRYEPIKRRKSYRQKFMVEERGDATLNVTVVLEGKLDLGAAASSPEDLFGLGLIFAASWESEVRGEPNAVGLAVTGISEERARFPTRPRSFTIVIAGQRHDVDADYDRGGTGDVVTEMISASNVPMNVIDKLARAKSAHVVAGEELLELDADALDALHDLVTRGQLAK